jgi:transcriptional regulator with XRE-family HTH domain
MNTLPDRFKEIRNHEGQTQKEFAETLGISIPAIQNYESGKSYPTGRILESLAMKGYSIDWLLIGRGEMSTEQLLVFKDLTLLKDVIDEVDEYFSRIDMTLPEKLRDQLILHIYNNVEREKTCLHSKSIPETLASILSKVKEFSREIMK